MKLKILTLIILLVITGFISSFIYWFQYQNPNSNEVSLNKEDLCRQFPKIGEEISCSEARALALNEFPGEVYFIGKNKAMAPGETLIQDVWVIGVKLADPLTSELGELVVRVKSAISFNGNYLFSKID